MFQLTAARRRLDRFANMLRQAKAVSTHSRPKAAGLESGGVLIFKWFQLTAARRRLEFNDSKGIFEFWFQLTAARRRLVIRGESIRAIAKVSTHSRPKAAGGHTVRKLGKNGEFQLTAARRRLVPPLKPLTRKACIALFR